MSEKGDGYMFDKKKEQWVLVPREKDEIEKDRNTLREREREREYRERRRRPQCNTTQPGSNIASLQHFVPTLFV